MTTESEVYKQQIEAWKRSLELSIKDNAHKIIHLRAQIGIFQEMIDNEEEMMALSEKQLMSADETLAQFHSS